MWVLPSKLFQIFCRGININLRKFINDKILRITLISILISPFLSAQTNIAVLNFTARDVTNIEAQVVSDRIRIALKNTGSFTVIERNLMDRLLGEQSLQQSGCTESDCMVEVGKLLSVKQIVGGSLSKIGNQLVIEAKLIDVETGEILNNVIKDFTGPYELLLSRVVPDVADMLSATDYGSRSSSKMNIALLEFESRGLSETEAAIISDRIRLELKNTGKYNVLEREMMKAILKEQSFQQSGCTESECLVEVGQLLSVAKMVGGSISKIGNLYVIEARIIDVESGSIDYNVAEDYSGPIELLLVNVTKKVAQRLAGQDISADQKPKTAFTGQADLYVSSTPAGGVIYFDGAPLNKVTPSTFNNLPAGVHKVKVEKGDLIAEQEFELVSGRLNRLKLKLAEKRYTAIIYSNPSVANVIIKGQLIGQTPTEYNFKKQDMPFDITIQQEGYFPYKIRIEESVETTSRINAELIRGGRISVRSMPESQLFINKKFIATTPYLSPLMQLGSYQLELRRGGYRPVTKTVELTDAISMIQISENLEQLFCQMEFLIKPLGADVFIDGRQIDSRIANNVKLPHGQHQLKLKKSGYFTIKKNLNVYSESTQKESFVLQPKSKFTAIMLSMALPGSGQLYYGKVGRGLVITGITAGLAVCSYYYNNEFVSSWDQFNIDLENYRNATTLSEIERTKKLKNSSYETAIMNRNFALGSMGALGAVWLYNVWNAGHNFKGIPKRLAIRSDGQNVIKLSYKF